MPGRELPQGTVSFLFTDVEGSTRLLQSVGRDLFAAIIEQHNRIIRDLVGKAEVSTEGDAFFCAFVSPSVAADAALSIQHGMQEYSWPGGAQVSVRMGLHTGEGRLGGDNYVGLDVHKAARIASAAYGGQVLLSDATRVLVERSLPAGASLLDLGEHRLKDLSEPEHLFQLCGEGLRRDFPTVRSVGATQVRLPEFLTTFVGRQQEITTVADAVGKAKLVTLVGIGGSGKTRLAVEAGRALAEATGNDTIFVNLVDATDAAAIAKSTAAALSLAEQAGRPIEETLIDFEEARSDLLIFDNCEQVADAAADLIERLLHSCPKLKVIATSREALLIGGEHLVNVGPMRLPDPARPDAAISSDAVRLFVSRARQARHGFEPGPWLDEIVAICTWLEGIPLAIELAAARTAMLTPADILARLDDRFALLKSRSRSGEPRHETLEATMDWSYDLLDAESQRLLQWLSIFRGGFTLAAVSAVCFDEDVAASEVLDHLTELRDKSLLVVEVGFKVSRFRLLETIREYAADRLSRTGDNGAATERHHEYFLSFAREHALRLVRADQLEALSLLEADHENLRASIRRAIDGGDLERAADLAGRLSWFWYLHAHFTEGERWAGTLLDAIPSDPHRLWLRLLIGASQFDYRIGEYERANYRLNLARDLAATGEHRRLEMWAHAYLATNAAYRIDMDSALREAERAVTLAQDEGDLAALGYSTFMQVNAQTWLALTDNRLTSEHAQELASQLSPIADIARSAGERNMVGHVMQSKAILEARMGEVAEAAASFGEAIGALTELGTVGCSCHCLEAVAEFLASAGRHQYAVRLLGAADRLRLDVGISVAPIEEYFRSEAMRQAEGALSSDLLTAEAEVGRTLSLSEVSQFTRQILLDM
jgi:predicted ATPase/class 3 adenylate cyclase